MLAVFASVTVVSYGVLPRSDLTGPGQPSTVGVLAATVGLRGGLLVPVGLVVSALGAHLAGTPMAAEVLLTAG